MIQEQQSQTQLQTHKVSSHSHDQSLLSLSVIVSSRLCPSLTLSSISSSVAVISVAAVAVFLLAVLWLICRKTAGEFQIYSFTTIKNSSDLTHRNMWIISNSQTEVYSCWEFLSFQSQRVIKSNLSFILMLQQHLIVTFCVFHVCFIINSQIIKEGQSTLRWVQ